jgi:hypothetical protein
VAVHVTVRQQPQLFELVGVEEVGFVEDEDRGAAAFVFLGGEQVHGLRDQCRLVEARNAAEGGDDAAVEASPADGGVTEVDHRVPAGVEGGESGADGDGLAGTDFAGDHGEPAFADAPADAGDGFGVACVAVQHLRREGAAERGLAEPVMGLEFLDHGATSPTGALPPSPMLGSGSWPGRGPSGRWEYCTRAASSAVCWAWTRRR